MEIPFTKMHGIGNDFVVINALSEPKVLRPELIRLLAHRRFGIGCDQLLLLEPAASNDVDVKYRIFNADGGEVEQCGNGARAAAIYLRQTGLFEKDEIVAQTAKGIIRLFCREDGQVTVNMGEPDFEPERIPLLAQQRQESYQLSADGQHVVFGAVSMGNPHAIIEVEDIANAPVKTLGPLIENHQMFPQRVNAGFMHRLSREHIQLRVFERGVGETLACGTGACAAVVYSINRGWLDNTVNVDLEGGELLISWAGEGHPVLMTGPAERTFDGVFYI